MIWKGTLPCGTGSCERKSHRFAERNDMFIHFSSLKVLIKHIFTSLIMLTPVG